MKTTRTGSRRSRGPTFRDLLDRARLTPAQVEAVHDISMATVYRARRGHIPGVIHLRALALAVGVTEEECRAAIERSGGRK